MARRVRRPAKKTCDFAARFMMAIAQHVDVHYGGDVDEGEIEAIEGELVDAIDQGLDAAYERAGATTRYDDD